MNRARMRDEAGFTLAETMIVVAILGILVAIAVLSYIVATGNAREVTCRQKQRSLQDAVNLYTADKDTDPDDIEDLRDYMHDFDKAVECPNDDGTELQYDAVSHQISCANHP